MITKRVITERLGDPAYFVFKGQYFDSGRQSEMRCAVCGADIRFCYILKKSSSIEDRSVPSKIMVGEECFKYFPEPVKEELEAAAVVLRAAVKAEEEDQRDFGVRNEIRQRMDKWRQLKRQALSTIRDYHKKSGKEWLPESLFELKTIAEKQPGDYKRPANALRWYDNQTQALEERLKKV